MGKLSQPKAPEAVDPLEIIRLEAAYNQNNQVNPFGSTTWSGDEQSGFTQTQELNPAMQAGLDRIMGRMTDDSQGYQRPEAMDQMMNSLIARRGMGYPTQPGANAGTGSVGQAPQFQSGSGLPSSIADPSQALPPSIALPQGEQGQPEPEEPGNNALANALAGIGGVASAMGGNQQFGLQQQLNGLQGNQTGMQGLQNFMRNNQGQRR